MGVSALGSLGPEGNFQESPKLFSGLNSIHMVHV